MWGFVMTMSAIRPNRIFICPDFPYGDRDIPDETVKFVAKLWYLLEKYVGDIVSNYTEGMGDAKFIKYHKDLKDQLLLTISAVLGSQIFSSVSIRDVRI